MTPSNVKGTERNMPVIANKPRRRRRLVNLKANRGANQGAPPSDTLNQYPFPFQGVWSPARHGHHSVFTVGVARRVGAWRTAGTGTLGGSRRRTK